MIEVTITAKNEEKLSEEEYLELVDMLMQLGMCDIRVDEK